MRGTRENEREKERRSERERGREIDREEKISEYNEGVKGEKSKV